MKVKKILLASMLAFVVVLLAGCGTKSDEKKEEKTENNNTQGNRISTSNVGNFAEYKGNLYYWKLTPDSRDGAALFANYNPVKGARVDLVKQDADGNETTITKTAGNGKIYIINDTIFYQSTEEGENTIYSVDLDGNNKQTYEKGEIKYAYDKYLFIQSGDDAAYINTCYNEANENETKGFTLDNARYIGMADSRAYFVQGDNLKSVSFGYFEDGVPNFIGASFDVSEYTYNDSTNKNISIIGFVYKNNKVLIQLGDVQGTGQFIQEGWVIEMDADGRNINKRKVDNPNEGAESLLGVKDLPVRVDSAQGIIYTNPDDQSEKVIVDKATIKSQFSFNDGDDYVTEVYSADKVGNKLYIIIDNGVHYPAGDVGWRYSYRRTATVAFTYDFESGEIEKIYELK